jgi:hypothetical protein
MHSHLRGRSVARRVASPSLSQDQYLCIGILRTVRHTPTPPDGFLVVNMRSRRGLRQCFITLPASIYIVYRRQFIFHSIWLANSVMFDYIRGARLSGSTPQHRSPRNAGMQRGLTSHRGIRRAVATPDCPATMLKGEDQTNV